MSRGARGGEEGKKNRRGGKETKGKELKGGEERRSGGKRERRVDALANCEGGQKKSQWTNHKVVQTRLELKVFSYVHSLHKKKICAN